MSAGAPLAVVDTVLKVWGQFLARPGYALRVAWIPVLLISGVGAFLHFMEGVSIDFWRLVLAVLNFAVLVQALVAWQRYALPESHPRKGATGLRGGRAEFFSLLHFPLIGVLFVPLLVPTLLESLVAVQQVDDGISDIAIGLTGLALLVFPGGLVLMRATMILPAIAAAGNKPISLIATANRVWDMGAGNSIRLLLAFYAALLPAILAITFLPPLLPTLGKVVVHGLLVTLYVMLCGGVLARAYGHMAAGSRKAAS